MARLLISNARRVKVAKSARVERELERKAGITGRGTPMETVARFQHDVGGVISMPEFECDQPGCKYTATRSQALGIHKARVHGIEGKKSSRLKGKRNNVEESGFGRDRPVLPGLRLLEPAANSLIDLQQVKKIHEIVTELAAQIEARDEAERQITELTAELRTLMPPL